MVIYFVAYPKYPGIVSVCLPKLQYRLLSTIIWSAPKATLIKREEGVERSHCLFMIIIYTFYSSEIDFHVDHAINACQLFTTVSQTRHSPIT